MKKYFMWAVVVCGLASSFSATAQFAKPEDAIKYRKAAFTLTGAHFGRLGQMAQGKTPFDAKVANENAEVVASMAKLPWAAFTEGSDVGDTKAKPEIWKQSAKFKELAEKLQSDTAKLAVATKTGKEDAFKTALTAVQGTCKSCHDDFRNK